MADFGGTASRLSACPACDVMPLAETMSKPGAEKAGLVLSLPTIHCASCITDVERALQKLDGVRQARVNLTLKRVTVEAPDLDAEQVIAHLGRAGFEAHELDAAALTTTATDRMGRDILMRIGVAGFAMMNIMILSVAVWSGAEDATRDLFHLISGLIAVPTVLFCGQPFFKNAWAALRGGRLGMDVPISLALILATAISIFETAKSGHHAYFDAAVMLCFFLLVGRYLDYRSRAMARSAAEELTALEVARALRLGEGGEEWVAVADLRPGDVVRVQAGTRVPADGTVREGMSEIDRSLLTGETVPVQAAPGVALSAGEVNLTGNLVMTVTAAGRDSSLSRLAELVAAAENARGKYTSLADRASRLYAPMVHILAALSFLGWYIGTGDARLALNIAAAVLIITCPCALGLAVPAVVTAASGRLFRRGLLIKEGTALERLAEVETVVFDKTGTLTMGAPRLVTPVPADLAPVAKALAQGSAHPLSVALVNGLPDVPPAPLDDWRECPGFGVEGLWQGRRCRLGRAEWAAGDNAPLSPPSAEALTTVLAVDGQAALPLSFDDQLRPGADELIQTLQSMGKHLVLLSGDAEPAVANIAGRLRIEDWRAAMTPMDKAAEVQALGPRVLMVGDGLNDTGALAAALVSISPASALDAARVASDIVLLGTDLSPVAEALRVAKLSRIRIKQNFAISLAYNIIAVPVALAGYATPLAAALAMSASSISVTLNALRLR